MISRKNMLDAALTLPPQERVNLVNDIWDSVAEHPDDLKLTAAQECELDDCFREYLADPKAGDNWATSRTKILELS